VASAIRAEQRADAHARSASAAQEDENDHYKTRTPRCPRENERAMTMRYVEEAIDASAQLRNARRASAMRHQRGKIMCVQQNARGLCAARRARQSARGATRAARCAMSQRAAAAKSARVRYTARQRECAKIKRECGNDARARRGTARVHERKTRKIARRTRQQRQPLQQRSAAATRYSKRGARRVRVVRSAERVMMWCA